VDCSCEQGSELAGYIKFGEFLISCATVGFSRRAQLHEVSYVFQYTIWSNVSFSFVCSYNCLLYKEEPSEFDSSQRRITLLATTPSRALGSPQLSRVST
jgi:hypothetical protein